MRDPERPFLSSYEQPGSALLKRMHEASSGHPSPEQLNCVQYPPGCAVSHWRSPRVEQSVERTH